MEEDDDDDDDDDDDYFFTFYIPRIMKKKCYNIYQQKHTILSNYNSVVCQLLRVLSLTTPSSGSAELHKKSLNLLMISNMYQNCG